MNSFHFKVVVKYSNHLNTRQVWYSNGPKVSVCRMVQISNGVLKTGQKMSKESNARISGVGIQMVTVVDFLALFHFKFGG